MRVTLKDIVEKTGVSKSVVSMYLNKDPRVRLSEEKKQRIDAAVRELGYRPSLAACALRKGRSRMLGLVLGGITNAYFSHFAEACLKYAEDRGYQLLFALTSWNQEKERQCLENLIERQVDGILYTPHLSLEPDFCKRIQENRVPILLPCQKAENFLSVDANWQEVFDEMISFFTKCGYRKIACCIYVIDDISTFFQESCRKHGLEMLPLFVPDSGREQLFQKILEEKPDAVFIQNCQTVLQFLNWCRMQKCCCSSKIVTTYNFPVDFIDDPAIAGVIFENFYTFVKDSVNLLIDCIEAGGAHPLRKISQLRHFYRIEDFMRVKDQLIDTLEKAEGKMEK